MPDPARMMSQRYDIISYRIISYHIVLCYCDIILSLSLSIYIYISILFSPVIFLWTGDLTPVKNRKPSKYIYVSTQHISRDLPIGIELLCYNYNDVTMSAMASQITSLTIVYSNVYSGANQRKHQSSTSLAFVWGIHRWPMNSPHRGPVTQKTFPFDDVIMIKLRLPTFYEWRIRILYICVGVNYHLF